MERVRPFGGDGPFGFTLIELLVVIAIIAILAVVVVLTLNPAQLLAQSRDANRVSDMATLQSALNLYTTDQSGNLQLGSTTSTYISVSDSSSTCGDLGMLSLGSSSWACSSSNNYRLATSTGWMGTVNFNLISAGSPFGSLPIDPVNQTSSGLFYAYNTNGSQFQVVATLESTKYKAQYGANPSTSLFPEVVSAGTPGLSALYNPTGLIGYWPLDEGNGSTTIDQSGNGNAGQWNGSSTNGTYYTSGKVGSYAGNFNGSSTVVNLGTPAALQPSTQISVTAWINMSQLINYRSVIGNYSTSGGPLILETYGGPNNLRCLVLNNTKSRSSPVNSMNQTGIWYFVGCTYDGAQVTLYLNGASQGSAVATGSLSYYGYPWFIGAYGSPAQEQFPGMIDDVRMYNRALSPAEMMALYNAED